MTATAEEIARVSSESDEDDDDDSVDSLAHISNLKNGGRFSSSSVQRYDEYQSFLTRSERAIAKPDKPPSPQDDAKRKVHFKTTELASIQPIERYSDEDKQALFMHHEDVMRIDADVELTSFRWENHLSGKIPFDAIKNTIRGLEHLFDKTMDRGELLYRHQNAVLQEIHNQKIRGGKINWDQVRRVSEQSSLKESQKARDRGQQDEVDRQVAWNPAKGSAPVVQQKKKKKGFFGLFGKK